MPLKELGEATYQELAALMHEAVGLSFPAAKKPLIASRLAPRVQRLGLDSYEAYVALIAGGDDGGEFQMAVDLLTTNETYFFREPAHFDLLESELSHSRPQRLRLWSAASSFGDEAYSLAMLLSDLQQTGRIGADWSILGTDISERVLRSAVEAIYPEERLRHVTPERLKRYCLRGSEGSAGLVQMQARLREHVGFGQLNLCRPIEELGPFDAIFLRNVLIYFDAPTKQAVVERVLTQLRPGGLFFIGTAEGRVPGVAGLQVLSPGAFRKVAA
ncbi:chemotaxis protein methyltransferase CheR [Pelomonas saccharophila]|uniref:Chemotaxis protein methyltransferase n=1 Tax=Roseateles saccharophilus TaxID=304 RepID=A0ABU1YK67_ROSSA|nr:protein-glutamate O-methyltransferase CheR [Roseateles saccharophilus]MDR7269258.1 chemotaxis protein methyltransferase CheR [Roseateles saccharophilus]